MKISLLAASAICDAIVDLIDGGAGAGTWKAFTGSAPTNTTDADSGTLLCTITHSDPAFANASNGVATAGGTTADSNVDATGTYAHWRAKDSNAVVIFQGTSAEVVFNSTAFVAGGTANLTGLVVTCPPGS